MVCSLASVVVALGGVGIHRRTQRWYGAERWRDQSSRIEPRVGLGVRCAAVLAATMRCRHSIRQWIAHDKAGVCQRTRWCACRRQPLREARVCTGVNRPVTVLLACCLAAVLACPDDLSAQPANPRYVGSSEVRPARRETLLAWDDGEFGEIENQITGMVGMNFAVRFQAPDWANHVVGIHYYIMDDQVEDPGNPGTPTTEPFAACVWRPNQNMRPGVLAMDAVGVDGLYPEDAWLEVTLPVAVEITNSTWFPDRQFFVGMEWLNSASPILGLDDDPPIDLRSFRFNWTEWELYQEHDAMIRAVVSDLPTWVDAVSTWSRIKALYSFP
jgi:hypothetical protein